MKIYIAGAPGSGKSYLARELATKLNIPAFELDSVLYETDSSNSMGNHKRAESDYQAIFDDILSRPAWIIEGVPRKVFAQALEEADEIVVLDFPKYQIYGRVLRRWIKQRLKLEKAGYQPTLAMLRQMAVWVHDYQKELPFPEKQVLIRGQKGQRAFTQKAERTMMDRLKLREIGAEDLDYLWELYRDEPTMRAFGREVSTEKSQVQEILADNLRWKAEHLGVRYLAFSQETDDFIGFITLKRYDKQNQRAEMDYIVCPEYRKNGYGSEMLRFFLKEIFREWPISRLSAYVALDNVVSCKLLEKNGFVREGILRNWSYAGGACHDCYSYSFTTEDLKKI